MAESLRVPSSTGNQQLQFKEHSQAQGTSENRENMSARRIGTTLWIALLVAAWPGRAQDPPEPVCTSCHDQGKKLKDSAHASVACATCHPRHEEYPHPAGIPKPVCASCHSKEAQDYASGAHGQAVQSGNTSAPDCTLCHGSMHEIGRTDSWTFRKSIPDLCGGCHPAVADQFSQSVHGKAIQRGVADAPVCTNCHTAHMVLPPSSPTSSVNPEHIRDTCGQCHGNVRLSTRYGLPPDRVLSFDASFHGMALKAGNETVANCSSCHGIHLILTSSDPRSTINPKNLAKTCGQCHPGAGTRFAIGPVHEVASTEPKAVRWARSFYLLLIPLVIGLMFVHQLGDWVRKVTQIRFVPGGQFRAMRQTDRETGELRMFGFERVQHLLLLASFTILVWTGFALKYPDGWWARPLLAWETRWPIRGIVHRVAAVVFMVVAGMHLVSLIVSGRLRRHWQELWPRASDATEALLNFAYNVGLRRSRPRLSDHSYIEKAEYWAVVWGAVVMIVTGLMLWANRFTLKWLPKSFLDLATTVHFYEAVLAGLAIVVWHFYSVIFDPDVYPMETAWLTGRSVKRKVQSADFTDDTDSRGEAEEKSQSTHFTDYGDSPQKAADDIEEGRASKVEG